MDNPQKLKKILKMLNSGIANEENWIWEEAEGYHSFGSVLVRNGEANFEAGKGVIVKLFVNKVTGEIRPYYFKQIIEDHDAPN